MEQVVSLAEKLKASHLTMATAESCTGGLAAAALTDLPGSSEWFRGAVVAYANQVKAEVLLVPEAILNEYGAVSEPAARAMAEGVCRLLKAEVGIAISGIAGPAGGTSEKPVGTVCLAWAVRGRIHSATGHFFGSRQRVREQSVLAALSGLLNLL